MKKRKVITGLVLSVLIGSGVNVAYATNDTSRFASNMAHYQELCARRSSFEANLSTCNAFESYLHTQRQNANTQSQNLQASIDSTRNDIDRIIEVIRHNEELIEITSNQIQRTQEEIVVIERDIETLENDIRRQLIIRQELTMDNFVIDFLMSSATLNDFFNKMDGFNAINQASTHLNNDFLGQLQNLEDRKQALDDKEEALERAQRERQELLTEQKTREAELFAQLEQSRIASLAYENKAAELNYNDIIEATMPELEPQPEPQPEPEPQPDVVETEQQEADGEENLEEGENQEGESAPAAPTPTPTPPNPPANNGGNAQRIRIPVDNFVVTARTWHYPASFGGGWHPGIDLANRSGTPILSPGRGVVLVAAWDWGYGNYLVTAHQVGNNTYTVIIGHLNSFVRTSGVIERGELIGRMGSTGWSTGPHAHIEIFRHTGRTLQQVVDQFNRTRDIYFGLGYHNVTRGHISRLKPGNFWGI